MGTRIKITKKGLIEGLVGCALLIVGFSVLIWTYFGTGNVDFVGNVWNRRFYTILSLALVSGGFAFAWNGWKKLLWFGISFVALNIVFILAGGVLAYSASSPNPNAFMILYDTDWTDIGLGIILISDAAGNLVPLVLLCLIIYQVLYSGEADENMKGILEGVVCLGFILAFNFIGGLQLSSFF